MLFLTEVPTLLPCTWKQLFGISCPFCGFQRSVWYLLHGEVVESLRMFPFLLPGLVAFGLLLYGWWGRKIVLLKWSTIVLLTMLVLNMIYQNIWN